MNAHTLEAIADNRLWDEEILALADHYGMSESDLVSLARRTREKELNGDC